MKPPTLSIRYQNQSHLPLSKKDNNKRVKRTPLCSRPRGKVATASLFLTSPRICSKPCTNRPWFFLICKGWDLWYYRNIWIFMSTKMWPPKSARLAGFEGSWFWRKTHMEELLRLGHLVSFRWNRHLGPHLRLYPNRENWQVSTSRFLALQDGGWKQLPMQPNLPSHSNIKITDAIVTTKKRFNKSSVSSIHPSIYLQYPSIKLSM